MMGDKSPRQGQPVAYNNKQPSDSFFLPDFCSLQAVFAVVLLSELFAIILTLAKAGVGLALWDDLALTSLFMQWAGLTGAAVLCTSRRALALLSDQAAALVSYSLLLLVVLLLSEVAYRFIFNEAMQLGVGSHGGFVLRNLGIGAIVSALALRYFYLQHQSRQRMLAESEARFAALQARIRPHFLFNSMNTIASLTRSDAAAAEAAIEDLADLFRASLGDGRKMIPLAEELDLTRRYLRMEELRLGERLRVQWTLEGLPQDAQIPPLTLQPLVENAIYHGIERLAEGGTVSISGEREGDSLQLTVTNPVLAGNSQQRAGNRVAVDNIRQRLAFHFGEAASLSCEPQDGHYRAGITLPYRRVD